MTTWIGTLARTGVVDAAEAAAGEAVAAFVVGPERLDEVRAWLVETAEPSTAVRERRAAVEVCIAMAHADRRLHPEESHLLSRLVAASGLDEDTQDALVQAVHEPPTLDHVEARLTHPVLRELILALAWELALADGRVDDAEGRFFDRLARRLDVAPERAEEIRAAVDQRID
ncbi:MAG TPA: DUF533 domain-containing protein [Sandaracinaceae bacterium LLY-WYZ-13_1]|nr:DUF533 domain-containing protein [Sandaracinaceae bacterium LLY-WYZ-13_1]